MIGIRKSLHNTVIRDGKRRMSPFLCTFQDILYVGDRIHIAHFGMAMQLHTFDGSFVHTLLRKIIPFFDPEDGRHGNILGKGIKPRRPQDLYKRPCFEICPDLGKTLI